MNRKMPLVRSEVRMYVPLPASWERLATLSKCKKRSKAKTAKTQNALFHSEYEGRTGVIMLVVWASRE